MAKTSKELMAEARSVLAGKWALAIGVTLTYGFLTSLGSMVDEAGSIISFIVAGPLALGLSIFTLNLINKKKAEFAQIFEGFNNFLEALLAYLLVLLFVLLWSLLLLVPGIIASFAYSQVFYIMADKPKTKAVEALKLSKEMMKGNKARLFYLNLRFFGWFLLSILTLGIGLIWLMPYVQVTQAAFYKDVKGK